MGRFEVQGVVSNKTGQPLVQYRQLDDDGQEIGGFQVSPQEAREIAHNSLEAANNAIYDAAIIAWVKTEYGEDPHSEAISYGLVTAIRKFRADHWGLPDQPKDWTNSDRAD